MPRPYGGIMWCAPGLRLHFLSPLLLQPNARATVKERRAAAESLLKKARQILDQL